MKPSNFNIPNLLTALRILILPFLVFCFFKNQKNLDITVFVIFVLCSITDYIDGIYARKTKQTTKLGQALDPLADKLFVTTTMILILGFGLTEKYNIIAIIIIMCREIVVSDMRASAQEKSINFTTSILSKIKTCTQMFALSGILLHNVYHTTLLSFLSTLLLWISAVFAIVSCIQYLYRYKSIILEK